MPPGGRVPLPVGNNGNDCWNGNGNGNGNGNNGNGAGSSNGGLIGNCSCEAILVNLDFQTGRIDDLEV